MKSGRTYTQRARAESAEATRRRILLAAVGLLRARLRTDIRLADVAAEAKVSVQTVLRAFGSRDELLEVALTELLAEFGHALDQAEPGDVDGSVTAWFDHYEQVGEIVTRNLADESAPAVARIAAIGRERHRARVLRQLAPQLREVPPSRRARVEDALVCACDVYTWKLLRRDMGRPRPEAEATMALMITGIVEAT
ncbi:TetR/AcrR family transcriptional regulator [Amycolatopsis sp. CA-230715]|uniref:TetR/AcrR family transcriptional regulator n=1 Tax=Amycolatopsis sp. CA-230715 TaxID=2745196 RepID=UPI001C019E03|nr:TetR/AcrR family transcriptional regulator [Amycolatopsis sp. CA-230715]QWF83899.1 hypothetical protein HUW46_07342 [Amycolatopsis sp. CA-230715]